MNKFNKYLFLIIVLPVFTFNSYNNYARAQGFNIDSFNASVQKLSSDTDKVNFMLEREEALPCEDSTDKLMLANEAKQLAGKINWTNGIYNSNRYLCGINFY